jgi:hypothetical protein
MKTLLFPVSQKTPLQIAADNADITCVGWWKAHVDSDPQWTLSNINRASVYTITEWDDSSGRGNDLTAISGAGPYPFGSGTNHHGDSSDEVEGYSAADFTNDTSENGTGLSDLFMRVNPSDNADFSSGGANNHFNFVCVAKQHVTTDIDPGWSSGDWQIICSCDRLPSASEDEFAFGMRTLGGAVTFQQQLSFEATEAYSTGTTTLTAGTYYLMGFFCTEETGGVDGNGKYSVAVPSSFNTEDQGAEVTVACGTEGGATYFNVGRNGINPKDTLHGRIVEMAAWKSTSVMTEQERMYILNYYKHKFGL